MSFRRVIPYAFVLGLLALIALVLGGIKVLQVSAIIKAAETMAEPEESVSTCQAAEDRWEQVLPAIGTVAAVRGVMVSTDLPGVVREISFESGKSVEKGDQLVKLDVSVEEAELESARASTRLAELNLKRERSLVAKRAGRRRNWTWRRQPSGKRSRGLHPCRPRWSGRSSGHPSPVGWEFAW